jgi:hypothetical protein
VHAGVVTDTVALGETFPAASDAVTLKECAVPHASPTTLYVVAGVVPTTTPP